MKEQDPSFFTTHEFSFIDFFHLLKSFEYSNNKFNHFSMRSYWISVIFCATVFLHFEGSQRLLERRNDCWCFYEIIACFQFVTCLLVNFNTHDWVFACFVIIYGISVAATRHGPIISVRKNIILHIVNSAASLRVY